MSLPWWGFHACVGSQAAENVQGTQHIPPVLGLLCYVLYHSGPASWSRWMTILWYSLKAGREVPKRLTGQQHFFNRLETPEQCPTRAVGPRAGGLARAECLSFSFAQMWQECFIWCLALKGCISKRGHRNGRERPQDANCYRRYGHSVFSLKYLTNTIAECPEYILNQTVVASFGFKVSTENANFTLDSSWFTVLG